MEAYWALFLAQAEIDALDGGFRGEGGQRLRHLERLECLLARGADEIRRDRVSTSVSFHALFRQAKHGSLLIFVLVVGHHGCH